MCRDSLTLLDRYGRIDQLKGATMNRLKDKIALVFGAGSSGPGWSNGKAAAVAYARQGARVVVGAGLK